jgi:hypothetical protein
MEQSIVQFTWNEAEFLRLTRKYGASRMLMRNIGLGAASAFGLAIALTALHVHQALFLYLVAVLYVVYGRWFWRSVPRRTWQKVPGIQGPQRIVFTDRGVTTSTEGTDRSEGWDLYCYVAEHDDCYVLSRTRRVVTAFFPKRAFASPRDEAVFRELARSHSLASLTPNPKLDDPKSPPTASG